MKLFEYIKMLDETGNYRLADRIDNELKKIYAQTAQQMPNVQDTYTQFLFKQMIQNQSKPKKETDTLSPTKNTDVATIRKQLNKVISDIQGNQKNIKKLENSMGAIPSLESQIGNVNEQTEDFSSKINDNTNNISQNTQDINSLFETVDSIE